MPQKSIWILMIGLDCVLGMSEVNYNYEGKEMLPDNTDDGEEIVENDLLKEKQAYFVYWRWKMKLLGENTVFHRNVD